MKIQKKKNYKHYWRNFISCNSNVHEGLPFTGQRQHSRLMSGVSHALQTHDVKSRTCLAP